MEPTPSNEAMEETKQNVKRLMRAMFGDPDNAKEFPGLISEFYRVEGEIKRINSTLDEIKGVISKVGWTIVCSVIMAVLALILK